jgi:hypothetical protein
MLVARNGVPARSQQLITGVYIAHADSAGILSATALLWLSPGRYRLITGRTRANMPASRQQRLRASEPVTRAKSYDQDAEERAHFLIRPDPRCPECAAIMDWRSAHREIAITNGAEIKLSDYKWGSRHLHLRDLRVAHHKNRVAQQRKGWERKEHLHPVA